VERAGLITKQRAGREQLVAGNPEALARARAVLDEWEAIWRGRIDRIDDLLSQNP
jgi:hypothetical protein